MWVMNVKGLPFGLLAARLKAVVGAFGGLSVRVRVACAGAAAVGFAALLMVSGGGGGEARAPEAFAPNRIGADAFFLPAEPDFLPEAILERERRESWSVLNAAPFWTDPREWGDDFWRERMRAAIDALLERVP
ncbi:MAG: hypothetical protein LBS82_04795 [Spirochaetaceae bacterium]|jgi:hypothetical protein|nr:hypothetical protein [Spirochaetaceae bacterium]